MEESKTIPSKSRIIAFIVILVMILVASFSVYVAIKNQNGNLESNNNEINNIEVDSAYLIITDLINYPHLLILDVRTESEYNNGHIEHSTLIPLSELGERVIELYDHKSHEILVYCNSGYRSLNAANILLAHNFTKIYNLLVGMSAWSNSGYPTVQ